MRKQFLIRMISIFIAFFADSLMFAQVPQIDDKIQNVRVDLSVKDGQLNGPGADEIRKAILNSCYVFIGEDPHGMAEAPKFADALTSELRVANFNTLALEISPSIARQLSSELATADPDLVHLNFLREYPDTVPFYNTREEFEFLKHAKARIGSDFRLIGFDQEFFGASKFRLDEIGKQPITKGVRDKLNEIRKEELEATKQAQQSGQFQDLFLLTADMSRLQSFATELNAENLDATPINDLLSSRRVYDAFRYDNFKSNEMRDLLMKHYFVEAHGISPPCKMLFKAGSNHGFRGIGPLRTRELGNFIAEIADESSPGGVHILLQGGQGETLEYQAVGKPMMATPVDSLSGTDQISSLKPFIRSALRFDTWSLFDLRKLRTSVQAASNADWVQLIYGYDFVVVVPHPTASHEIR
jgi:hypothetical protein